jgi:lipoprotein Spr/probable lipoprotein NlpC
MIHNTRLRNFTFLIAISYLFILASCSSRKYTPRPSQKPTVKASKAADVMADLEKKDLYTFITDWTGVKYKFGGMDKNGIDCSGFSCLLLKEVFGVNLPRRSKDQADASIEKDQKDLREGDLVFFSFGGTDIDHVGVYLKDNLFVHASTTRGVIIDKLTSPVYQKTLVKTGTVR